MDKTEKQHKAKIFLFGPSKAYLRIKIETPMFGIWAIIPENIVCFDIHNNNIIESDLLTLVPCA